LPILSGCVIAFFDVIHLDVHCNTLLDYSAPTPIVRSIHKLTLGKSIAHPDGLLIPFSAVGGAPDFLVIEVVDDRRVPLRNTLIRRFIIYESAFDFVITFFVSTGFTFTSFTVFSFRSVKYLFQELPPYQKRLLFTGLNGQRFPIHWLFSEDLEQVTL
jgi:hypothetical protein